MPCRRTGVERVLLLERAPAVALASGGSAVGASSGSKEVDALVAKLGEVLQLSAQRGTPSLPAIETPCRRRLLPPKHHSRDRRAPYSSPRGLGFLASLPRHSPPAPSLVLLTPPAPPPPTTTTTADAKGGSPRVAKQLCGRGWLRSATRASGGKKRQYYGHSHPLPSHALLPAGDEEDEEDDPHRLLQQLILSGNLIKEAVRRLQLAVTVNASTAASETSTTGSPGSASSSTESCCHSSGGERDSGAAPAAFAAVAPMPALP